MPGVDTTSQQETVRPVHELTRSPARTDTTLAANLPESLRYRVKRALLGPPLVSDELHGQRLGKPTALAVLSSDVMSSSAYASEEMLRILVPDRRVGGLLDRHADDRRHPGRPRRGDDLLPGRGPLLSQGRRLLRREPRQLRSQPGPDRRRRPAHQLHDHRRRIGGGGSRRHHLGRTRPSGATPSPCRSPSS